MIIGNTVLLSSILLWTKLQSVWSNCAEPSNVTEITLALQNTIKENYLDYMSFLNIESFLQGVKGQLNKTLDGADVSTHYNSYRSHVTISRLHGQARCSRNRQFWSGLNRTTSEMSSCPWYYVLEVDTDRIPLTVVKAKCSCKTCILPTRREHKRDREGNSYCKEVSYRMPMIRRDCLGGIYRYRIAIEDIPVGCTCQMCNRKRKQGRRTW